MVLEARYKAEKIWYPIIWERAKESSDVIDYNIQEEITKDASSVVNANNDTTTGMATVIPWVNAPKLIAKTSIIWIDFNAWYVWWVKLGLRTLATNNIPWNSDLYVYLDNLASESDKWWPYDFKFVAWKWLVIPSQWTYKLECTFYSTWWRSSGYEADYQVIMGGEVLATTSRSEDPVSVTVTLSAKKWQWIMFLARMFNNSANACQIVPRLNVTITKL